MAGKEWRGFFEVSRPGCPFATSTARDRSPRRTERRLIFITVDSDDRENHDFAMPVHRRSALRSARRAIFRKIDHNAHRIVSPLPTTKHPPQID
jgi:hypothetical protein